MDGDVISGKDLPPRSEPRWPVALSIVAVLALLTAMPDRVRLLPPWVLIAVGAIVLAAITATALRPRSAAWPRIERAATFALAVGAGTANLVVLVALIFRQRQIATVVKDVDGLEAPQFEHRGLGDERGDVLAALLASTDRGGPASRASAARMRPDWIFPRSRLPDGARPAGWRPCSSSTTCSWGFHTATAFSTTDALPLTRRAKLAMMIESLISLATLVVVGARAINVLGP